MFRRRVSNLLERVAHANRPAAPTVLTKTALEPEQAVHRPLADAMGKATELMQQHGLTDGGSSLIMRGGALANVITIQRSFRFRGFMYVMPKKTIFAIRFFMKLRMRLLDHITAMMRFGGRRHVKSDVRQRAVIV